MQSPTSRLVAGLAFTLLVISAYAFYSLRSVWRLRDTQTRIVDRNRQASTQLLRIQGELNTLGLTVREMLDEKPDYPLEAWQAPLRRVRENLDDALRREAELSAGMRAPQQSQYLAATLAEFWRAAAEAMEAARAGDRARALMLIRNSLQPGLASLHSVTARWLVDSNDEEARASDQVRALFSEIERNAYIFLALSLALIVLTSLGLIHSNRALFAQLGALAEQRSDLARQLIATQESTFRSISRDLHDEFGQILTALGALLRNARKHAPGSAFEEKTLEASTIVQRTLERIRSLSQSLQPVILEEQGLLAAVEWQLAGFERHTGIAVRYRGPREPVEVRASQAIHVFRILQESLNNVARHAQVGEVDVMLRVENARLILRVADQGTGLRENAPQGLGLAAMRERAGLIDGTLDIVSKGGGTVVTLSAPLALEEALVEP
ncbi:MAG: sensor histidine kinase [Acidobacteriota bacterium]